MYNVDVLKRHAALVDRMATRLGLDLEEKALRAEISIDQVSDAVLRCTKCSNADHCEKMMASGEHASTPPGFCRNTELFASLMT